VDRTDLLSLCRVKSVSWHFIAREAQRPGGLERLLAGSASEGGDEAKKTLELLAESRPDRERHRDDVAAMVREAESEGYRLTTVLDDDYPVNLRTVFNLPPFLFYRGELRLDDAYSVAVVGTREASLEGLTRARRMAALLAEAGVTVLSGLARGIDTAAHQACLEAGGRTVAVLGTGIRRIYPPENAELADRIAAAGAVVSQFWPDSAPTSYSFPRRNVVMSGMGQGTVVIEASATSGAKMQARLAIEHGKQVFLLKSLVTDREWARKYLARPRVREVSDVEDIIRALRSPAEVAARANEQLAQLALALD
jgi:DNA processing protein